MIPTPDSQEENFSEIKNLFNFPKLLSAIELEKQEKISETTQKYLRGVLQEGSTKKVAQKCYVEEKTVSVNLSKEIVPYLKAILELPESSRIVWRNIPKKLKEKGFMKPQDNTSKLSIKSRDQISFDDS